MDFMKLLELQDYIQNKLADLETAKDGSLEQFIKNVERLMEKGYTFAKDVETKKQPSKTPELLSPEELKMKMIKETINKSKRASSTMRTGYDAE